MSRAQPRRPAAYLSTNDGAARSRLVEARNFHLMFRSKNIRPRIAPRPDLNGARCTSDRAAISIYIATTDADVKLPLLRHCCKCSSGKS
jgi:hypothetical protein